jgi:serine protease Do
MITSLLLVPRPSYGEEPLRQAPQGQQQIKLSFAPLVKKVSPAVVNIYTKRIVRSRAGYSPFMQDPFFRHFFGDSFNSMGGMQRERVESALGSGVIVDPSGVVITNAHVVKDADEITVALPSGKEFTARKSLVDEASDLAVLRIIDLKEVLPFISLKPSESLEVGDLVLAIGNPFGVGQTVTSGIVSALARSSLDINDFNFFIQTDAAINPGNSGGPLVDLDGHIVGINTAIFSRSGGSLGIGFAIPSEMVATVIAAENSGQYSDSGIVRPWLGITAQKVTSDIAESLGLETPRGVLVARLHKESPISTAGGKVRDIVLAINGKKVKEPAELKFRMATIPLGDKAVFTVLNKNKERDISVEAIAPPESPGRDIRALGGAHPLDGATVSNINPAVIAELSLDSDSSGVVVVSVQRRTEASRVVRAGDIILSVNGSKVRTVDDAVSILNGNKARRTGWELILSRNGSKRQIIIR